MPFLSIELGKQRFKVLLLERAKDALTVLQDVALTIMPTEDFSARVSETIRDFIVRYDVTDRKVYLAIADSDVITLKNVVLPSLPASELVPALNWHAKEEGALTDETMLFNYEVVKEFTGEDGAKKIVVTFSVVHRKLLENCFNGLSRLGLEVLQVTAAPLDIARVLSFSGESSASQGILDLGYGTSTLAIYKKGKLLFIRTLSFSYAKVRLSLNDPLLLGKKYRTPEAEQEIEQAILTIGIPREEFVAGPEGERATQCLGLLRPLLEALVREIRYSLTYFTMNLNEENPAVLYLSGHGAKFRDLDFFLSRELAMSVLNLELPPSVRWEEKEGQGDRVHLSQCVSGVAAVIPGPGGVVDFMPYELKCRKSEAFQRGVLRMVSLALLGVLFLAFFLVNLRVGVARDHVKIQQKYLQALGKFAQASEKPFERYYLARKLEEGTVPPEKILKILGHVMPSELAIRSLLIDSADRTMTIDLETSGMDERGNSVVEDLVRRFQDSRFFRSVHVISIPGYAVSVYRIQGVFRDD